MSTSRRTFRHEEFRPLFPQPRFGWRASTGEQPPANLHWQRPLASLHRRASTGEPPLAASACGGVQRRSV
jgi:hypothetical protein